MQQQRRLKVAVDCADDLSEIATAVVKVRQAREML
jgi:hypothetical protein